jgi:O-antigen/teichoic acid export membrane protein
MTVMADQAISSGSNFLLAVVVGRLLGPNDFGAFALVVALWLLAYGLFRAVVADPMTVFGESSIDLASYLGAAGVIAGSMLVAAAIGAAFLGVGTTGGAALGALAVALPFLLVQDFWRRVAFMRGEPLMAVWNDVTFLVVQLAALGCLWALGAFSAPAAVACWGLGAGAGAALGIRQFRPGRPSVRGGVKVVRQLSTVGSWLALDFVLNRAAKQVILFLIAWILSTAVVGGIQASVTLVGFTNILILGGTAAALSDGSRAQQVEGSTRMRRVVGLGATLLTAAVGGCILAFAILSGWLLPLIYGARYDSYVSIAPLVAVGLFVQVLDTYPVIVLRIVRDTYRLFICRLAAMPVGLSSGALLVHEFGLVGAALATVAVSSSLVVGGWVALLISPNAKIVDPVGAGPVSDRREAGYAWADRNHAGCAE